MFWLIIFTLLAVIARCVVSFFERKKRDEIREAKKRSYGYGYAKEISVDEEEVRKEAASSVKKIKKLLYGGLCAFISVITALSMIYTTNEQQIGYTMTFGVPTPIESTGIHFKLPFVTSKHVFDAVSKEMAIGYNPATNDSLEEDSLMITSDFNFVNVDFCIEYRISDPIEYEFGTNDPEGILKNIVLASIRNTVGLYKVDEVLTSCRAEIEAKVKALIIEKLEGYHTGLHVLNVSLQDAEPPSDDVKAAFDAVEGAKQNADKEINDATAKKNSLIPAAEAEADKIIQEAEAAKAERMNQAKQEVAEFNALYTEYQKNPDVVKQKLYFAMLEEILPKMEIMIGDNIKVIYVKGDSNETQQAVFAGEDLTSENQEPQEPQESQESQQQGETP